MSAPTCYYPDGTPQFANTEYPYTWKPCNSAVGSFGSCCMSNHSVSSGISQDLCQPNGLCTNWFADANGNSVPLYWAPICSDKEWDSPNCVNLPVDKCGEWGLGRQKLRPTLKDCKDNRWCCGDARKEPGCCADESKVFELAATVGVAVTSDKVQTSTSSSSTGSPVSINSTGTPNSASNQASSEDKQSSESSSPQSLTIAVGIPLGVLALVALAVVIAWFVRRHRKKSKGVSLPDHNDETPTPVSEGQTGHGSAGQYYQYYPSPMSEMWTEIPSKEPAELHVVAMPGRQPGPFTMGHPPVAIGELGESGYMELPGSNMSPSGDHQQSRQVQR